MTPEQQIHGLEQRILAKQHTTTWARPQEDLSTPEQLRFGAYRELEEHGALPSAVARPLAT